MMRVLYVGALGPRETASHRRDALVRLGHEVHELDVAPYYGSGGALVRRIRLRTLVGRPVNVLNREVVASAERHRPDVIWFDKPLYVWPETIRRLRALGAFTIHFTIDNPFGPRGDPGWRHILHAIPEYDLHLVQRDINIADYKAAGARDVRLMRTAYEETIHFPPKAGWSDLDRVHDVVFIGAPYDSRPKFVTDLWKNHGISTKLWGSPNWADALAKEPRREMWQGRELWNADYRETIWRSRFCLAFVTHSNCDDVAHKSFEIAACGGFLLAEDTPGHRACFTDGLEAVFFRDAAGCAELIHRFRPDELARARISTAAARRARESGYSNDARLREVFAYVERAFKNPPRRAP